MPLVAAVPVQLAIRKAVRSGLAAGIVMTVRYLGAEGRAGSVRATAQRLRGLWRAQVPVPAEARQGIVSIATRGDLRHYGQGLSAALPG